VEQSTPQQAPTAPGSELFGDVFAAHRRELCSRARGVGAVSVTLHLVALALAIAPAIFTEAARPERPDVLASLIYDPPPPPQPPLPRGSALRARPSHSKPARPIVEHVEPRLTAAIETPQTAEPRAEAKPEAGASTEDAFGSPTGADLGDPLGEEGGVEGGLPGGVPGGVVGGVPGGTGNGPVLDYDSPPRLVRAARPVYPHEAFVKKIEGEVLLEILIDPLGRVARARVLRSVPLLDDAALQCVNQWAFQPAVKHGRPVLTVARAPVRFQIF
jgi:protein TonB